MLLEKYIEETDHQIKVSFREIPSVISAKAINGLHIIPSERNKRTKAFYFCSILLIHRYVNKLVSGEALY